MKRLTLILALVAMPITTLRLPAQSCILSTVVSEQACQPGSCANKVCCRDAEKNTATAGQPLGKADAASQPLAPGPAPIAFSFSVPQVLHTFRRASRTLNGQARPAPALLCTFLI